MASGDEPSAPPASVPAPIPAPSLREPLVTFFVATALASALYWAGKAIPLLGRNVSAPIAVIFLYAPAVAAYFSRRPFDHWEAGLRLEPLAKNLRTLGLVVLATFPLFIAAFLAYYEIVCRNRLVLVGFGRLCPGQWHGAFEPSWTLPPDFARAALMQLIVVAIPEELFFRGYLMGRLEALWPSTRKILGVAVGKPLLVSSVLFALGHVLVDFNPQRFAVFFPALLFGWMRARTGSLAAAAFFHAMCNLLSDALHTMWFGV